MTGEQEQKYRDTLARASTRIKELMARVNELSGNGTVAVVGIGCRFPGGADSPESFWKLLEDGVDTVSEVPADRWNADDWYNSDPAAPGKSSTRRGAFLALDALQQFDAQFFGISPAEAASLDPQQRLLMETSWEALESSATEPKMLRGSRTGVFVGVCGSDYAQGALHSGDTCRINPYSITGVLPSVAGGRLSYLLDLHGPNISLDTACSSSLVAILLAMKSLLARECDAALAGGVNLMLTPGVFVALSRMNALSPDGVTRAFGEHANGFVRGEGCGMLYLKRLEDAEQAGDPILAVLRGGAMNHDGQSNGLTAPNALSQQEVVRAALAVSGLTADAIDAVETHGTGTPLGDPIEARSLAAVFSGTRKVAIGSVKTNIGHLEVAAGVAGAIKAILMVNRGMIPPSLHAEQLNSHIPWETIPLRVTRELQPFPDSGRRHAVGVSSFGFSGTNAHLIVQEYRRPDGTVFPLSSKTPHRFKRKPHWIDPMAMYGGRSKDALPETVSSATAISAAADETAVLAALTAMVTAVSGLDAGQLDTDVNLFELGLDSLMLIQLRDTVNRDYGVTLELANLMDDANTLSRLATFVATRRAAQTAVAAAPPASSASLPLVDTGAHGIERFFTAQLAQLRNIMEQQLEALRHAGGVAPVERRTLNARMLMLDDESSRLSEEQRAFIASLIERHTSRTGSSKKLAQRHRRYQSDWINTLAYRECLKELAYPIASVSSHDACFTDLDGNEYLDLAMGFGVAYFGHSPSFVAEAIRERLGRGMELATQLPEAGEAASLFCRLTGMERVTFCNTGSDAVMMALRLARTVTGRDRIVLFAGSYHGTTDGVLAFADDSGQVFPTSPGIPFGAISSVTVLPYGSEDVLEKIRAISGELAAILVEPVQSRRPGFHPVGFLRELRAIADDSGAALIFDEMITGFRCHPGGVQALFGIRADMATYGKAVGGGMPISMVAGSSRFLDAVDGGYWQYGDDSSPTTQVMFFGGTFCRHPLAVASSLAAMRHLEQHGPALQEGVNRKVERLAQELNEWFVSERVPMLVQYFTSLFRFESYGQYALLLQPLEMELFFYLLMKRGIYTWERRICFFSTAHTDADVERIITAVKESIAELRAGGFPFEGAPPEPPRPFSAAADAVHQTAVPMSSAQKRIYILSQYDDGDTPYHLTGAALIEGALDVPRLTAVFEELVRRHDSLRTAFEMHNGELVQCTCDEAPLSIECRDALSSDPDGEFARIVREGTAPYSLSEAPLMRIKVVSFPGNRFILLLDIHHIAADGFSINILISEFARRYAGETLPPLTHRYRDHVERQLAYLSGTEAARDADWSLKRLSGTLPTLRLPTDYPRPPQFDFAGDLVRFRLNADQTGRLKQCAREQGTTLFMVMLAAFYTLLHRLAGDTDIIVGTPVAGRDQDLMGVVGMFADTLPLRVSLDSAEPFSVFLKRLSRDTFQAFEHQRFPLELLVERLNLKADVSRNPLFDASFVFEKADDRVMRITDLTVTPLAIPGATAMFDLSIEVAEEQGELACFLEYATSLFARKTAERWAEYYVRILDEVVKAPDTLLVDIDMLPPEERAVLMAGGETIGYVSHTPGTTVVHAITAQALATPDAPALVYPPGDAAEQAVSYGEMNRTANRLARHLAETCGVGRGQVVAVSVGRSPDIIVALLAVSKAGAAFLPLERSLPRERISYMLADSEAVLLLSDRDEPDYGVAALNIANINEQLAAFSGDEPASLPKPDDLAYVIYTSGSTGLPKGCLVEHGSFMHYNSYFVNHYFGGTPYGAFALFSTLAFDMSLANVYPPLLMGKPLYIYPESMDLTDVLRHVFSPDTAVDSTNITPSHVSMLEHLEIGRSNFGVALVGGEQFSIGQARILRRLNPAMRIYNEYGPTEFTVGCIASEVLPDDEEVVIGRPIAGTEVFILDAGVRLAPIGVPGEICLGGAGITRGYLKRPELTAEKFVPHPFRPGERIYRTGDIGIRRADGLFHCMGRYDDQVKIRGYRIELAEIEHALRNIEGVADAVVLLREIERSTELVAFVAGAPLCVEDMRIRLAVQLPEYMIPRYLVTMERLPVTAGGKADRAALARMEPDQAATGATAAPLGALPGAGLEQQLARIWSQVLQRPDIRRDDNFFAIGGQSLKAVQAAGRIQKELSVDLKLRDFFTAPTVAGLAALAASRNREHLAAIEPLEHRDAYPLSHGQKRFWLLDQMGGGSAAYNMTGAWQLSGPVDVARLKHALEEVMLRHEVLRTTFALVGGMAQQIIHDRMEVPFRECDLTGDANPEQAARRLLTEEGVTPFDLAAGPLLRVLLLNLPLLEDDTARPVLVFTMHHIISDGWSVGVLSTELSRLYAGLPACELPALRIQYKEYAVWQQNLLAGAPGTDGRAYWMSALAGAAEPLELPTDFPRPDMLSFNGSSLPFRLGHDLTGALNRLAATQGVTLFMLLLAAIKALLHSRSGQEQITVGTPVAGREHPDLENQIGLYLNTLALRDRVLDDEPFSVLLERVRTTATDAFTHQYYPFDRLLEDLAVPRDPARNPLFDVLFVLQNIDDDKLTLGELRAEPFMEDALMSKFDLMFDFKDLPELCGNIEYCSDLFLPESITAIAMDLETILTAVTGDCDITVAALCALLVSDEDDLAQREVLKAAILLDEEF